MTRLPPFYLFYLHELFAKFFGFFGLITISLLLITFQAYWPLSRPIEFNSFLRLPQPIYFFFTSFYSHGLTTSLFGLPQPIYLFFPSFLFLWAYWPSILPFQPTRLISLFLCHFPLLTFSIVVLLLLLGPLSTMGINTP